MSNWNTIEVVFNSGISNRQMHLQQTFHIGNNHAHHIKRPLALSRPSHLRNIL